MISTRVLLVFAALALTCIAVDSAADKKQPQSNEPGNCGPVSSESFDRLGGDAIERKNHPAVGLGNICKIRFHKDDNKTKCIGYAPRRIGPSCTFCCACRNGTGIVGYNRTPAPKQTICGRG
uniref:Putative ixostatin n=1 Tax=Ixodes ricinus TaxID=34613 RepID=A0A0K8R451_IXORI